MRRLLLIFVIAAAMFSAWMFMVLRPADALNTKSTAVTIVPGDSLSVIAQKLSDADLIRSPFAFSVYARASGSAKRLQAGTFGLSPSQSASEIIVVLESGKSQEFLITIPEGFTVADIDALMAKKGLGQPGDIIDCAFHCDFSSFDFLPEAPALNGEQFGIGSRIEGYLFPETYSVSPGDYVPKFFLERMLGTFRKRIILGHADSIKASGRSLGDIVIMGSLVESESRHNEERAVIAGILWKRLKNGVVLGVDATTRYRLGKKTEVLTKEDVEMDSKYNTRRNRDLPPSAISNPGESSILAALNPSESSYWYYLHGSDGSVHYAVTNDEHNLNRARYLK